jgi:EARP and GARP complex-interacting protein 1
VYHLYWFLTPLSCSFCSVIWWPLGKHDKLISIDDRNIFLWNVDMSNKSAKVCHYPSVCQYIISILARYFHCFQTFNFITRLWNVKNLNTIFIWIHTLQVISQGSADMLPNLSGGAWDPHNHNSIASISDSSLHLWDLRSMELIL